MGVEMNLAKTSILCSVSWATFGCVIRPPAEVPPAHVEAPKQPTEEANNPLAEVIARCAAVQRSPDLPVSCQVDVVNNVARMQLTMANRLAAAQYANGAVTQIAAPFCDLANQASEPAGIVLTLYEEHLMQVADCTTRTFSEWQPTDRAAQEMMAATRTCEALQASKYPVGCGIGDVDGVPSLIVSYAKGRISESDLASISREVAVPFCDANTSSGTLAVVYLVEDNKRAKGFNCVTRAATAWQAIRPSKPRPGPAPGRGPSGGPNGYRPSYNLLPGTTASR
jgi:hypothetical protein